MSAVEQFTYAASPWGRSTPGWMTFQKSPGIEDSEIGKISSYYRYGRPDGWDGAPEADMLSSYPVQFVFARPQSFGGDALLVQTTFTGERWYDPRPGDWFAHGLRIPSAMLAGVASSGVSVFRWLLSLSLEREYPDTLRGKAMQISKREIPWENPPDLPALDSLDELEPNTEFDLDAVLGRMADGAWPKLGSILSACVGRAAGAKALVFDATKPESLDTMAALLALMPQRLRIEAQFATYFHAENVREVKADDTLLFYGIVREGESADPDTGLYGELPHGGPEFASREDVELFKNMVDACGDKLVAGEFDSLVKCWEVARGRDCSVKAMQTANAFCVGDDGGKPRYIELHDLLLKNIAAQLSEDVNADDVEWRNRFATARFEIGVEPDEYARDRFFEACVMDLTAFDSVCQCVRTDPQALRLFLKELESVSSSKEFKGNLAERLLETNMITKGDVIAVKEKLPLINLMFKYREIVKCGADQVNASADDIKVVEELKGKFGISLSGMDDVLGTLKYKHALLKITSIEDIAKCLKSPFPRRVDLKGDILSRVKPSSPQEKVKLARAFDAFGISGDKYVVEEWDVDVRSRDKMSNALKDAKSELEKKARENVELRRRLWIVGVICILLGGIVIGWIGGRMFKPAVRGGKNAQSESHNPPTAVVTTQKTDAVSLEQGGHGRVEPKDKRKQTGEPAQPSSASEPSSVKLTPVETPSPAPKALGTHAKSRGGKESRSTAPTAPKPSADDGRKIQPESPKHDEFEPTQEVRPVSEPLQRQSGKPSVNSGVPVAG